MQGSRQPKEMTYRTSDMAVWVHLAGQVVFVPAHNCDAHRSQP
jgi:hypothetical protein